MTRRRASPAPARKPSAVGPLDQVRAKGGKIPPRLRDRERADGSWRLWWEPTPAERHLGFEVVELDPNRLTWSLRQAEGLNRRVQRAREGSMLSAGATRTVSALAAKFRASPRWGKLKPATRRDYDETLRRIEKKWGATRVAAFTKPIVYEWYETLYREKGASLAAHDVRVLSVLMTYGELVGWVTDHPALRLKLETPPPRDRVVSWEEFGDLLASAEKLQRPGVALGIAIAWYQGQRQTDVLAACAGDFIEREEEGEALLVWAFERSKARAGSEAKHAAMPIHDELRPLLDARLAELAGGGPAPDPLAPVVAFGGQAYAADTFRHHFAQVRAAAAKRMPSLRDVQFRDLRRSWAWWSREGGASERDRADGLGNQSDRNPRLGQTYNPPAFDGARRAVQAMKRPGKPAGAKKETRS
ncbi:hypothetical protein [Albimonas pacifica]|uniref:Core-binding (CB) domain-containing protein n=1 Tax=Albimonas pacifica TaxID=1114924 RepID=A0A1I3JIA4_9RHOB|nr:hypothetical protein [Albimonas pacifica]SFI59977.1 hypothetical protein SAMN05216258_10820 [Albimonas pacifica]